MSRSSRAARYGALVERAAADRYGLDLDHRAVDGVRVDARDDSGRPWDVKGAMMARSQPRFRLWRDQHEYLEENNGGYVFASYQPRGQGVRVLAMRSVKASDVRVDWYGAGGHRHGQQQAKIPAADVLSQ